MHDPYYVPSEIAWLKRIPVFLSEETTVVLRTVLRYSRAMNIAVYISCLDAALRTHLMKFFQEKSLHPSRRPWRKSSEVGAICPLCKTLFRSQPVVIYPSRRTTGADLLLQTRCPKVWSLPSTAISGPIDPWRRRNYSVTILLDRFSVPEVSPCAFVCVISFSERYLNIPAFYLPIWLLYFLLTKSTTESESPSLEEITDTPLSAFVCEKAL